MKITIAHMFPFQPSHAVHVKLTGETVGRGPEAGRLIDHETLQAIVSPKLADVEKLAREPEERLVAWFLEALRGAFVEHRNIKQLGIRVTNLTTYVYAESDTWLVGHVPAPSWQDPEAR